MMKRRYCMLIFLLLGHFLPGYDVILPEDEAPAALFPVGRSDENVSLYIAGSWKAAVSAGFAVQFIPGTGPVSITSFPGMSTGANFYQTPDLTLSFRYLDRYFFETSLAEDFSNSLFLLGYQGREDETLQQVSIGNTGTSLAGFSYLALPDSPGNSLGARVELAGRNSKFSSVLRYDPAEDRTQTYRGMNLVEQAELEPAGFIRGRFFALPDDTADDIQIFIEAAPGDGGVVLTDGEGRVYRRATSGESWVSPARALVHLTEAADGRVLAFYEGMTISGTVLNTAVSDRVETIGGTDYLVLNEPGVFSPFEVSRYYQVPLNLPEDPWRVRVYLGDDEATFRHYPESGMIALTSPAALPFDDEYKYPLLDDGLSHIYGPQRESSPSYSVTKLLVETLTPVESFQIDPDYLPASVTVYRDGFPETGFTLDDGGILTFDQEIGPADLLEIHYSLTASSGEGGDLVFGTGGTFETSPGLEFSAGLGVVWDVLSGSYSTSAGDNPGSVLLTGGMDYTSDNLDIRLKAGLSVSNPDTSGYLRLKGMEDSHFSPGISQSSIYPAAVPEGKSHTNRGKLFFRDYNNYNAGGGTLMDYSWTGYEREPYETGSRTGPYTTASGTDDISGRLMGLDWEIDGTGGWAGAQLRIPGAEAGGDLSAYRGVSFLWRGETIADDTVIEIQLGALGEDLDGDAGLDGETGIFDDGFAFNHAGQVLRVGSGPDGRGNGSIETEDADGNGRLYVENPDLIASFPLEQPPEEGQWQRVRIFFTEEERKKLTNCTGMRVIITSSTGEKNIGTMLIGDVRLEGSTFVPDDETVKLLQVPEVDPDGSLAGYYPETQRIFHPAGGEQKVLDVRWTGDFSISSPVTPVAAGQYEEMVFYFAPLTVENAAASTMTVSLTDVAGRGIHCSFTPAESTDWHKIVVDAASGRAYLDGSPLEDAEVTVDPDAGLMNLLTISLSGSSGGRMLLDEIHLSRPMAAPAAGAEASLTFTRPGVLLSLGEISLVSDLRVDAFTGGNTTGFLRGITPGQENQVLRTSADIQATVLTAGVSASLQTVFDSSGLNMAGGHTLRYPAGGDTYIEDSFTFSGGGTSMERGTTLALLLPEALSCSLTSEAYELSGDLVQEWKARADSRTAGAFEAALDLSLTEVSPGYTPGNTGYFGRWFRSYHLLAPLDSTGAGQRSGSASGRASLAFPPVSLVLNPKFSYAYSETEDLQTTRGDLALSVPFGFGKSGLDRVMMDITYRRTLAFTGSGESSGFSGDLDLVAGGFTGQRFFFANIPFYEIFSFTPDDAFGASAAAAGMEASDYTPSFSISLTRRYGSFLRDLFLPSSAVVTFSRELKGELESWTDHFAADVSLTASAMNLFGSRGAYPVFDWYRSDEFSGSVSLTRLVPLRGGTEGLQFVYQGYMSFSLEDAQLTSDHRLDVHRDGTGRLSYRGKAAYLRNKPIKNPPPLPFIAKDIEKEMVLEHNEEVEFLLTSEGEDTAAAWTVYLGHGTAFLLPGFGSLGVYLLAGITPEPVVSGGREVTTWLAAVETGIEGNIRY